MAGAERKNESKLKATSKPTWRKMMRQSLPMFHRVFLLPVVTSIVLFASWTSVVSASAVQDLNNSEGDCTISSDGKTQCSAAAAVDDASTLSSPPDTGESFAVSPCQDASYDCEVLAERGKCISEFKTMRQRCPKACLLCDNRVNGYVRNIYSEDPGQKMTDSKLASYLALVDEYMYETVYTDPPRPVQVTNDDGTARTTLETYAPVREGCKNRHEDCTFWASIGECTANPAYMKLQCAPACFTCDFLSFETRCPYDKDAPQAWSAGDLNRTFARILENEAFAKYKPRALSQPNAPSSGSSMWNSLWGNSKDEKDTDNVPAPPMAGPWVVVLDEFLTPEECDVLIDLGAQKGYERSKDVGKMKFDGTYDDLQSEGRTSSNAWCVDECHEHEVTKSVHRRMEELIQVPQENYEYLQMLRYEVGQRYGQHHDYIHHHLERAEGVRILTIFLYLNDVDEGGGTKFPYLNNMVVTPKKGRALIWPSVQDKDPNRIDRKMDHEALPVVQGIKYGANAWIHQRDFKAPWKEGCH